MNLRSTTKALFASTLLAISLETVATPLFAESFEDYLIGTTVSGQGGWAYRGSGGRIRFSSLFDSQVLDGASRTDGISDVLDSHRLLLPTNVAPGRYVQMTFDSLALQESDNSYAGLFCGCFPGAEIGGDAAIWEYFPDGWRFELRRPAVYGPTAYLPVHLPANVLIHFAITLDNLTNEVWGSYDAGGGWADTAHLHLPENYFYVGVHNDQRVGRTGIVVDNILVDSSAELPTHSTIPLPGTPVLAGLALLIAAGRPRNTVCPRPPAGPGHSGSRESHSPHTQIAA